MKLVVEPLAKARLPGLHAPQCVWVNLINRQPTRNAKLGHLQQGHAIMLRIISLLLGCLVLGTPTFATRLQPGEQAPPVTLPQIPNSGTTTSLASLRGQIVYVDFWASWCGPCRISFPVLNDIRNEFHDQGFEVYAISVDEYEEDALGFLEELPVAYPVVLDSAGEAPASFGVLGMPTGFLIDRNGVVREVHQGFKRSDADKIRQAVLHLLTEDSK